jgi:hypothetical protein
MPSTTAPPFSLKLLFLIGLAAFACNEAKVRGRATESGTDPGRTSPGESGGATPVATLPAAPSSDAGTSPATSDARCTPLTCTPAGGTYCGPIGDGCGRTIDCGTQCPMGQTCGGGGTKNLCGAPPDPNCKPIACEQRGARLCGKVGDGCGGAKDCGACPMGETCGAAIANVCGTGQATAVCDNLCKQQMACPGGQETTVTGTVFAPTPMRFGPADPLYNALVYVPNRPVEPFPPGVSCDLCGAAVSGQPLVTALSGADGKFTLKNVPVGDNIPLVIQIGRWRRQVTIPKVTACSNTALPAELTRLPRNQSEGSIPQMAIATGTYDAFECVLRKIGIDEAEFTPPTGNGRVHMYAFEGFGLPGQQLPSGNDLVGSVATLSKYDLVLLPCDANDPRPAQQLTNVRDYAARGGRLFLTDWSYVWLKDGGQFEGTASWLPASTALGTQYDTVVDQTFPKGMAFAQWLQVVGASRMPGRLPIVDPYFGESYFSAVTPPTQRWLYTDMMGRRRATAQHFTFNTPIGAFRRQTMRPRRLQHLPRRRRRRPGHHLRPAGVPRVLPQRLLERPHDPAGKGARVHVVRRHRLRDARRGTPPGVRATPATATPGSPRGELGRRPRGCANLFAIVSAIYKKYAALVAVPAGRSSCS